MFARTTFFISPVFYRQIFSGSEAVAYLFIQTLSVADPGCLSLIPIFSIPEPVSRIRIKEFKYFLTQKSGF
jgi:hypothetical protein